MSFVKSVARRGTTGDARPVSSRTSPWRGRAVGIALGVALDAVFADPRSGLHPVAVFGRGAAAVERRLYGDDRARGVGHVAVCVGAMTALGAAVEWSIRERPGRPGKPGARSITGLPGMYGTRGMRGPRGVLGTKGMPGIRGVLGPQGVPVSRGTLGLHGMPGPTGVVGSRGMSAAGVGLTALTALATWAVLGGTTLGREGAYMARALEADDLVAARDRLPHLCGRDPSGLSADELARATVESIAENTSDAVVAPLVWGAVAGVPGLLAYRAINTLDAMVGHRSERYERFGWAAARLDDVANYVPARITGALACVLAPLVGGSPRRAAAVLRRDGGRHPSPNSGRCEAAFAGALGVRLGGRNVYAGRVEHRPVLGDGRDPRVGDIARSVRLARAVNLAAAGLAVTAAWTLGRGRRRGA
ncbi:cobalamin biosynthesis protein [Sphaerisporangium sp. NPDC005288]|uniref:cobalamin biosynthesis protein n=1 Tax=Sphaerisporangium sp. NPDC005288 TaxID=3155114 RepID=UPI0033BCA93E